MAHRRPTWPTRSAGPAGDPDRVQPFVADVRDLAALDGRGRRGRDRAGAAWTRRSPAPASSPAASPLWEVPAEQQQAVLDIDLGGVLNLARAAIPALLRRPEPRSGRFLAVASAAATRGLPMLAAYCAAKAGVTGLIRALAVELGRQRRHRQRGQPRLDRHRDARRERPPVRPARRGRTSPRQQPLGRLLDPAEVAAVLAFLAGPAQQRDDRRGRPGRRRAGAVTTRASQHSLPAGFGVAPDPGSQAAGRTHAVRRVARPGAAAVPGGRRRPGRAARGPGAQPRPRPPWPAGSPTPAWPIRGPPELPGPARRHGGHPGPGPAACCWTAAWPRWAPATRWSWSTTARPTRPRSPRWPPRTGRRCCGAPSQRRARRPRGTPAWPR